MNEPHMGNEYDPQPYAPHGGSQNPIPWRIIIPALALLWTVSMSVGGLVIAGMRDMDKRISSMESQCAVVQDRLRHLDTDIEELQRWRGSCGSRMAAVEKRDANADETLKRLETRIDGLVEMINRRHQ